MSDRSTARTKRMLLGVAAAVASLTGCDDAPTRSSPPATTGPAPVVVLTRPAVEAPIGGAAIPQNVASEGCAFHPDRGHGFQIVFRWRPSEASRGVAGYEIVAQHLGSERPMVDTFFPSPGGATTMTWTSCRGYVADANLDGWVWRVRARDTSGSVSDWSDPASFRFEPCRINRRQACSAS